MVVAALDVVLWAPITVMSVVGAAVVVGGIVVDEDAGLGPPPPK